jgi:hypothetical protein
MIIGATGHQNIPEAALVEIRQGIERVLMRYSSDLIGVSSLAEGADQLFARAVLELGGRLHAVIPSDYYDTTFTTPAARARFSALLGKAYCVETLDYPQPSENAFLAAGQRLVELSNLLIAVWDGKKARGRGGTGDIVQYARDLGREVIVVWPEDAVR